MAIDATAETFDKDVQGSMTVVDFWAPWCGPCKMVSPIVDEVANQLCRGLKNNTAIKSSLCG